MNSVENFKENFFYMSIQKQYILDIQKFRIKAQQSFAAA
jgi:hypothetical protein